MKNTTLLFYLAFLFLNVNTMFAKNGCTEDDDEKFEITQRSHTIVYGSAVNFMVSNATDAIATWELYSGKQVIKSGTGNETAAIAFPIPGKYKLFFYVTEQSTHHLYKDSATIEVLSIKMKFLVDQASINKTVVTKDTLKETFIIIPVVVESYDNKSLTFNPAKTTITGVDGITMTLSESVVLSAGTHELKYKLTGIPASAGKAQVGFFNNRGEGFFYNFLVSKLK
jgi:hypothetical protein